MLNCAFNIQLKSAFVYSSIASRRLISRTNFKMSQFILTTLANVTFIA